MSRYAEPMARLIEELKKLPGVGTKSAQRFAFHILRSTDEDAEALSAAIQQLKQSLRLCSICNNITDIDPCGYPGLAVTQLADLGVSRTVAQAGDELTPFLRAKLS